MEGVGFPTPESFDPLEVLYNMIECSCPPYSEGVGSHSFYVDSKGHGAQCEKVLNFFPFNGLSGFPQEQWFLCALSSESPRRHLGDYPNSFYWAYVLLGHEGVSDGSGVVLISFTLGDM